MSFSALVLLVRQQEGCLMYEKNSAPKIQPILGGSRKANLKNQKTKNNSEVESVKLKN